MEHHRTSQPVQIEQEDIKIEGEISNQEDVNDSQSQEPEEVNENESIEMRPQNVIISSNEGKARPQDGTEEIQNSSTGRDSAVGQIE